MNWEAGAPALVVRGEEAETLNLPANLTTLLADSSATGGALSILRTYLDAGADGARPHHHKTTSEIFYVIDGAVEILVGDQVITAGKGDLAAVPLGMMHAFAAASSSPLDMLIIIAPGVERFGYFRLLKEVVEGGAKVADIFESQEPYDNWFAESAAWSAHRAVHRAAKRGG